MNVIVTLVHTSAVITAAVLFTTCVVAARSMSREHDMVGLTGAARIIAGMNVKEVLAKLKSLGDDARRAHNTKTGAPENQFGVKLGDLRAVAKKIKSDHELALGLWETGNVEAQLLATLIVKPASLSASEVDRLTRST